MISERLEHTTVTINIHGVFDTKTAKEFSFTVQRAYRMGFREIYVSLKSVTMIDKSGVALLSNVMDQLRQQGCTGTIIHFPSTFRTELQTQQKNQERPSVRKMYSPHVAAHLLIA